MTKITLAEVENKCKSLCTIYVLLIAIIFIICIGIGTYFIYYKHINHDKKTAPRYNMSIKQQIIDINGEISKK